MVKECCIIFDLFGTLTDIESDRKVHEIISKKLSKIHDEVFKPEEHFELYEKLIYGQCNPPITSREAVWKALEILSKNKGFSIRISRDEVYRMHRELHIRASELYDDVLSALNKARSLCEYILLVTDADRDVAIGILKKHVIYKYFNKIIIGEEFNTRKPDPKLFSKAINGLNVNRELCFVIGDSWKDVEGSKASGLKAILVLRRRDVLEKLKAKPDYIANSLTDAVNFIEKYLTNTKC